MAVTIKQIKFEHEFWLQVLGDHSRFILDSLVPSEKADIGVAQNFKDIFDQLLNNARRLSGLEDATRLLAKIEPSVLELRKFKLSLLERSIFKKVKIHLSPTFINHMVNELDEYVRINNFFKRNEAPPIAHELHHHLLWLQDAYGHAGAIKDQLDATETKLRKKAMNLISIFNTYT